MTQPTFDIEKRSAERVSTERPVTLQSDQTTITAKMIDLSKVGVGILSDSPIEKGNEIQVIFSLPNINNKDITLYGIVARTAHVRHQYLIGVQFKDASNYLISVLDDFVRKHLHDQ